MDLAHVAHQIRTVRQELQAANDYLDRRDALLARIDKLTKALSFTYSPTFDGEVQQLYRVNPNDLPWLRQRIKSAQDRLISELATLDLAALALRAGEAVAYAGD